MNRTDDVIKEGVSIKILAIVLIIDAIIFVLWIVGYSNEANAAQEILKELPNVLRNLATISATIFGVNIARKGVFSKGGTKYYPTKHGEKKLKNIINEYEKYNNYTAVLDLIHKLLISQNSQNSNDNIYFKYVYKLQKSSDDFVKVWNDYNYYGAKQYKTGKEVNYYKKLEKYIFIKVYEEYKKDPDSTNTI